MLFSWVEVCIEHEEHARTRGVYAPSVNFEEMDATVKYYILKIFPHNCN